MNQKAFLQIVMPFRDKVYRFAKSILISQEEAEDATQELYLKLWNKRYELETYQKVEAFAMTITKNYCLDRLKSKQAENITLEHNNYKNHQEDIHKTLEINDEIKVIKRLIELLPEQQRLVIQLRDIEQYEFDEIGLILNMNPSTVRVNLSRARKTIKQGLCKEHKKGIEIN